MHNVANISPARNRHGRIDNFAASMARDAFATQARQARQWDERRGFRDLSPGEVLRRRELADLRARAQALDL